MGALATALVGGLRRRRLAGAAIATVLLLSTGAATLALNILVESQAPFDNAFTGANGAHLALTFDTSRATASQIEATAHASGVTETAGPWPVAAVGFVETPSGRGTKFQIWRPARVAGRPSPSTSVDRMTLTQGRWWVAQHEIVVSAALAATDSIALGDTIVVQAPPAGDKGGTVRPVDPGSPSAGPSRQETVVGIAQSISTPDVFGWLSPSDMAAVTTGQPVQEQMLYRVSSPQSASALAAEVRTIEAALPDGALAASQTYLAARATINRTAGLMVPILLAFALFALLAAAFMIVNVVSGIVLSSYRDIGVMKAIGFTPGQVSAILVGQILVPAVIGSLAGIAVGAAGSQPVIGWTAQALGLPVGFTLSPLATAGVFVVVTATVVVAALGPATRAGRLSAAAAMTRGAAPSLDRTGGRLRRLALRLPIAESARLGLATGLARPLRAVMTLGAVTVGVAALVFSLGVNASLQTVGADLNRAAASPVRAEYGDGGLSPDQVTAAIESLPTTAHAVAIGQQAVDVSSLAAAVPFVAYEGDSSWLGYALISGRWFSGPGEAVAPSNFFTRSGFHVGSRVGVSYQGRTETLTLVGEIFDLPREQREGLVLRGEWSDLAALDPSLVPDRWEMAPKPGTDRLAYASQIGAATGQAIAVDIVSLPSGDTGLLLFEGLVGFLGVVLVAVAGAGVFNTVLLDTRERVREIAVLKALGMSPRGVAWMVLAGLVPVALVAGLIGVPLGLVLQRAVLDVMGQAAGPTAVPESVLAVFGPAALVALGLAGLPIGAAGAWLPAQRAARSRIAPVLQAE